MRETNIPLWEQGGYKELKLTFTDGTVIDNSDIYLESMEITETLCDEPTLKYGKCSAKQFKVRIFATTVGYKGKRFNATLTVTPMKEIDGKEITYKGYNAPSSTYESFVDGQTYLNLGNGDFYEGTKNGDTVTWTLLKTVEITESTVKLGTYTVVSEEMSSDRQYKDIIAYDDIYVVANKDASEWYNGLTWKNGSYVYALGDSKKWATDTLCTSVTTTIPTSSDYTFTQNQGWIDVSSGFIYTASEKATVSGMNVYKYKYYGRASEYKEAIPLNKLAKSLLTYLGISYTSEIDNMVDVDIYKTVEPTKLVALDVLQSICEVDGSFGQIDYYGRFTLIRLGANNSALYPSNTLYPSTSLYPSSGCAYDFTKSDYKLNGTEYNDSIIDAFTKVNIKASSDDVGFSYPSNASDDNAYNIIGNFLLYGASANDLATVGVNFYQKNKSISYTQATLQTYGKPFLELGDWVSVQTNMDTITFPILKRTMRGITAISDVYEAKGSAFSTVSNSLATQIEQLKGKSNTLTRTIEGTQSVVEDLESNLISKINQSAEEVLIDATKITLDGATSITSEKGGVTYIDGGNINTDSLTAKKVLVKDSDDENAHILFNADGSNYSVVIGGFTVDHTGLSATTLSGSEVSIKTNTTPGKNNIVMTNEDDELGMRAGVIDMRNNSGSVSIIPGLIQVDGNNVIHNGNIGNYGYITSSGSCAYATSAGSVTCNGIASNTGVYSGSGDGYGIGSPNDMVLKSWYGIGFEDGCMGNGITASIDCRTGTFFTKELYVYRSIYGDTTSAVNMRITNDNRITKTTNGSSRRFKNSITSDIDESIHPHKLYDVDVVQYKYNTDYNKNENDSRYDTPLVGFIAEDLYNTYRPSCDYEMDENGKVVCDGWNPIFIIPSMLYLIQEQHKDIEYLKTEIETLKAEIAELKK